MATVQEVTILSRRAWRDEKGEFRRVTYQVLFDEAPTDPAEALDADDGSASIPSIGDNYPGSTSIKCKKVGEAQQDDDAPRRFEVPVEYSDLGGPTLITPKPKPPNPLDHPADIEFGFAVYERVVERAWDSNDNAVPVLNAAHDPFDPPLTEEVYRLQVTINRNVSNINASTLLGAINTINTSGITIAGLTVGAGQAMLKDWSATNAYDNGIDYIRERIVVEFAPTFDREVLNIGVNYIKDPGAGATKHRFLDDDGEPQTEPQLLDANGEPTSTATYLTFRTKEKSNFSAWNLPTTFPDT